MQYMLMIFSNADVWSKLSPAEAERVHQDYTTFMQGLVKNGHLRGGARLHPATTATVVREKQGKPLTTDGPFIESKEQLGGYFLVECKDLDEALSLARGIPSVRIGDVIEVRPVMSTPQT